MGNGSRIYIGGLPHGVRERDLERFFKGYGRIREILLKNGYGFVEFEDYRDADDAVHELNGKELLGERVTVQPATGQIRGPGGRFRTERYESSRSRYDNRNSSRYGAPVRTEHRLIVENLSTRISWQDLKDYMRSAGEVTYADAHKLKRNEGVVEFASASDMRNAIDKLDDTELNGRRIRLVHDRRALRGGGRRSETRSRSRSRSPRRRSTRSRSWSKKSRDRSRSRSEKRETRSRSWSKKSRDRSRSRSDKRDSRSRSNSPKDKSVSKSRSNSPNNKNGISPEKNMDNMNE